MTADVRNADIDPKLRSLTWILVLGALAPALDTTMVNVAMPVLGKDMHVAVATSQWIITGYLLAMGMAMPLTGWLSERFGGRAVWLFSLALFLIASAACGAAWDIASLIACRFLQGAAAGLMMPVLTTILVRAAGPRRLGALMAIAALPLVVVPILGPVAGGLLVGNLSWRWIFYINLPLCLAAWLLAWRSLPATAEPVAGRRFDFLGLALLSPGLGLLLYGASQLSRVGSMLAPGVLMPVVAGAGLVTAFVVHALRMRGAALVNLEIFAVPVYAASTAVVFLAGLSIYGPMLLLALYFQDALGMTALATGLLLIPQGLGALLPRGLAGKMADRMGARPIVVAGLFLSALGTLAFALAGPSTNLSLLEGSLVVRGAGLTAVTIAAMASAFRGVAPKDVADASSTTRIVQQVGGAFGSAVLAVILARQILVQGDGSALSQVQAFNVAFWWAIGFSGLTLVPALLLPGGTATAETGGGRQPR